MSNINSYIEEKIMSMSKEELLVFVYENLIKMLEKVEKEKNFNYIPKIVNIIVFLDYNLNYEYNKEFAMRLHNIYLYSIRRLYEAVNDGMVEKIIEIRKYFQILLSAWKETLSSVYSEQTEILNQINLEI